MNSSQAQYDRSSSSSSISSVSDEESSFASPSPFSDIKVRHMLSKAKFSIYLAECPSQKSQYALKMFPYQGELPNPFFLREIRFSNLKHANIINPLYHEVESITTGAKSGKVSFLLTEYAPNGDFFDLVSSDDFSFNDKITRTYFHQLISGLEYLHSQNVFHLDIKLENLLLDKDYNLRICDFDLSHGPSDHEVVVGGTVDYRAPELIKKNCKNPAAADIYSAAIVLFAMMSNGILPYKEEDIECIGETLFEMLLHRPKKFWQKHCRLQGKTLDFWSNGFVDLFNGMTRPNSEERLTIQQIKSSEWYNGPTFSQIELKSYMSQYFD